MKEINLIKTGTIINALISIIFLILALIFSSGSNFNRWGPQKDLHLFSWTIDTTAHYIFLIIGIVVLAIADVFAYDVLASFFMFNIYDDSREIPRDVWKREDKFWLGFFAQLKFAATNLRLIFFYNIITTQIDLALISWLAKEITSAVIIYMKLNLKNK